LFNTKNVSTNVAENSILMTVSSFATLFKIQIGNSKFIMHKAQKEIHYAEKLRYFTLTDERFYHVFQRCFFDDCFSK